MGTTIYDQVQILPTKECRVCDQLIDSTAVCCPHCQASQPVQPGLKRSAFITLSIASIAITLGLIGYWADNRDLSNKDINPPVSTTEVPAPTLNVDMGADDAPVVETHLKHRINIEQTINKTNALTELLSRWPPGLTAHHSQPDISELEARLYQQGVTNVDCSIAREILLELLGASEDQHIRQFNSIYESSRSCRPYTPW